MSKWDIDWKKVGRKKGKKVTEPSNGVGTGVGTVVLDRPMTGSGGGVRAAKVTLPQKPNVYEIQTPAAKAALSFLQDPAKAAAVEDGRDAANVNDVRKTEDTKMDTNTITKSKATDDDSAATKAGTTETARNFKRNGDYKRGSNRKRGRDMTGGMELLEVDFLLGVVEDTGGADKNDVMMRKLCFNELVRADHRGEIDSVALSTYAVDTDKLYGKDIQCQAMLELTERTSGRN